MTEQQVQENPTSENTSEPTPPPESTPDARYTDKDVDKLKGGARKEGRSTGRTEREQEILNATGAESVDEVMEAYKAWQTVQEETQGEAEKERKAREKVEAKLKELEPYKEQAERYKAALEEHVQAQMEGLPDYLTPLLNGMDPVEKLTWLNENREKVTTPTTEPQAPRGVPPTPVAHNTTQTEQDAAAKQARLDARRSGRSRI